MTDQTSSQPPSSRPGRLLPMREVVRETGRSRTTIWRMIKAGKFPPGQTYPDSPDRFWTEAQIEAWKREILQPAEPV